MKSYVYFLRPTGHAGPIKIGHSCVPYERLKAMMCWSPLPLELVAMTPGGDELEHRLHAAFAHLHSHGEWFNAAPELTAVVETILTGQFDPVGLPGPRRLHKRSPRSPEAIAGSQAMRDLGNLRSYGVEIPLEISELTSMYYCAPAEKERRRAIIRTFVEGHSDVVPAARRAAHAEWRRQRDAWVAKEAARRAAA